MCNPRTILACLVLVAPGGLSPTFPVALAATGANESAGTVTVMRGTAVSVETASISDGNRSRRGPASSTQTDDGVIVIRPAPDSFLVETRRLAAEAAARDERRALYESQLATELLLEALQRRRAAAVTETYVYTYWPGMWPAWRPHPRPPPVGPVHPPPPVRPVPPPPPVVDPGHPRPGGKSDDRG